MDDLVEPEPALRGLVRPTGAARGSVPSTRVSRALLAWTGNRATGVQRGRGGTARTGVHRGRGGDSQDGGTERATGVQI